MPGQQQPLNNEKLVQNGTSQAVVKIMPQVSVTTKPKATASVVVPPDGGWGWIVMLASFVNNVIVDGIVMTAGMFLEPIANDFNASKAEVAFVTSLLSGFYLLAGPFVSALANRWGFRVVTIIGAVIASAAFVLSYFASSIPYLYVSYGIIGGIGFCFIYMPSVITVGYYFEKWRALATGISLCGSGVGTFVFAPLNTWLLVEYGWRNSLLIQAAVILTCALMALVFRPLKPIEVEIDDDIIEKASIKNEGLTFVYTKPLALPEGRFAYSVPNSVHNTWIGASHNTQYPTAAEVFRGSGANLNDRRSSGNSGALSSANIHHTTKKLEQLSKSQKRLSGQTTPEEVVQTIHFPATNVHIELKTVGEDLEEEETNENGTLLIEDEVKPVAMTARRHTVSGRRPGADGTTTPGRVISRRESHLDGSRPLYRDDIFFSGSLIRIPQYQSQSSLGYHMSVTRMPTKHDVEEEVNEGCKLCPEAMRRTLATMLDVSLLKSPSFMLLALSGFFTMMGFFVPFTYITPRAEAGGLTGSQASMIVSTIGISNTIARIGCGLLSSFQAVNALHINNIAITFGGLATIFSGISLALGFQISYAAIFGIAIACFSALRSILVVDLMGLEKLTNAFGILMLFQGIAATIGTPIAGAFMDLTGSYDASFWLSGSLITLSAILCYPLNYVKRWETERNEKSEYKKKIPV